MFQSSPVLWDGRYIIFLAHITPPVCFNPRPSCGTGATKLADPATVEVYRFQSSPVLWDGRYSAPGCCGLTLRVSILARPVGRALLDGHLIAPH